MEKFCKDCGNCEMTGEGKGSWICRIAGENLSAWHLVTGEKDNVTCMNERMSDGKCGPEGKNFKPREGE